MKFGKRLQAEAERRWLPSYLDYKALKRAIQVDVDAKGEGERVDAYTPNHEHMYLCSFLSSFFL